MKKCTSCAKDLPDAAMHCVFCGAKQAAVAPPAGANAKTVMGWQASDLMKDMAASGAQPAPGVAMPPPAAPPAPAPIGNMQTLAAPPPSQAPRQPSQPPMGVAQTLAAPPPGGPAAGGAAAAKTMFAQAPQNPGAAAFPPAATMPAPSAYGGPNPGAAAFPAAMTMPAPSAYGGPGGPSPAPSQAASAATMFAAPAPSIPGQGPLPGAGMPPGGGFQPPNQGGFQQGPPNQGGFQPPNQGGFQQGPPNQGGFQQGPAGYQPPGPGGFPPPGGGYGAPGGFAPQGGPLPGAGMPPPAYAPPPMQQPMPPMQPMSPPYLASRTAARAGAPRDPYADGLRLVLIVFGALLVAAFVAPLSLGDKTVFRWDVLSGNGSGVAKFDQVYLAAAGVLALVFGMVSLANVPRGLLAAVLGLTPIALHFVLGMKDAPKFRWQEIAQFVGLITLVPGLLLRQEYRSQMLPRLLTTIGALCVLLPLLIPEGGGDPKIKMIIDGISKASGKGKVLALLQLYPVVLAALALLCWLPAPSSGAAKVLAWMFIVSGVVATYVTLLVMGHIGAVVKRDFSSMLFGGWIVAAWIGFIGYGLATVLGKNLEHS
ncbi:MAG: hypothetical protein IPL61_30725 [Myxococcales bacterium]|nr:hypothetical protein [Myxococcales bacterium]